MATVEELKNVLKETLDDKGILSKIRAQIRSEIFNTLNDNNTDKPRLSEENLIINELIREYLKFNDYSHTLSVMVPETGQPQEPPFKRDYIAQRLKLVEDGNTRELPLLYGIVFAAKKLLTQDQNQEKQQQKILQELQPHQKYSPNVSGYKNQPSFDSKKNPGEQIFQ